MDKNKNNSIEGLKWIEKTIVYEVTDTVDGVDNVYEEINELRKYPMDILKKLDDIYDGLFKGIDVCDEISESEELSEISRGYEEWLRERLIKALSVIDRVVYRDENTSSNEDDD